MQRNKTACKQARQNELEMGVGDDLDACLPAQRREQGDLSSPEKESRKTHRPWKLPVAQASAPGYDGAIYLMPIPAD